MAEERLRRNLDIALDPGPDFPRRLWLSQTMAALAKDAPGTIPTRQGHRRPDDMLWRHRQLAAAFMLIALAVAATAGFLAIHSKVGPVPAQWPRYQVRTPGAAACAQTCNLGTRLFTSETVGWVTESRDVPCKSPAPACFASPPMITTLLFQTTDGAAHWRLALNLGNASVQQILATPDGLDVLVVGSPYDVAPSLFRSTDSGRTWRTLRFPAGNGSFPEGATVCARLAPHVFFLNPNEGWVIAQTDTYASADVFHTMDGGLDWALTGTFDIKQQFNADVVTGFPCKADVSHELPGDFQFQDSTTGWYLPYSGSTESALLYRTQDGGLTWKPIDITLPSSPEHQYPATVMSLVWFTRSDGAAEVSQQQGSQYEYIFLTSDAGLHWSNPVTPPIAGPIQLIDAAHWVGWPLVGGWMRTGDAGRHWEVVRRDAAPDDTRVTQNTGLPQLVEGGLYWYPTLFQFVNPSVGFANVLQFSCRAGNCQGAGVSLYKTADGGTNWTPLSLPDWL